MIFMSFGTSESCASTVNQGHSRPLVVPFRGGCKPILNPKVALPTVKLDVAQKGLLVTVGSLAVYSSLAAITAVALEEATTVPENVRLLAAACVVAAAAAVEELVGSAHTQSLVGRASAEVGQTAVIFATAVICYLASTLAKTGTPIAYLTPVLGSVASSVAFGACRPPSAYHTITPFLVFCICTFSLLVDGRFASTDAMLEILMMTFGGIAIITIKAVASNG